MWSSFFFFFATFGVALPFFTPALLEVGYSRHEAGLIVASTYIFGIVMPLLGGRITDKLLSPGSTLRVCSFAMALSTAFLWYFSTGKSWLFLLLIIAYSAARAPVVSLLDALAMQVASDRPEIYARMRMTGSVGFAIGSAVFGYMVGIWGIRIFFAGLAITCMVYALVTLFLPTGKKTRSLVPANDFWKSLGSNWWLWLTSMVLHWISFGPYHYGFTMLLQEQGVADGLTGWFWSLGVVAEIFMFLASGWFFARWRVRNLLLTALLANLIRWIAIGLYPEPWVLLLSQLLHGFGFGLFYASAMSAIAKFSGGNNRASFQGLFSSCVGGIGSVIGVVLSGWLHESMPLSEVIWLFVPLQVVATLLLWRNPLRRAGEAL